MTSRRRRLHHWLRTRHVRFRARRRWAYRSLTSDPLVRWTEIWMVAREEELA